MSWPADGLPRYTTASIAGDAGRDGGDKRAIGYVYDRGRCHWPVLALRDRIRAVALRKAEEAAAVLNVGGELAPEQRGERPHGLTKYKAEGCRCEVCREGVRESKRRSRERRAAAS